MIEDINQVKEYCKFVVQCLVNKNYQELMEKGILNRVSEKDIKSRLDEYNSGEYIVMPPNSYFDKLEVHEYNNKTGYWIDIDLWYTDGISDLTLQLEVGKDEKILIEDLRVL